MIRRNLLLVVFLAVSGAMHLALFAFVSPGAQLAVGAGSRRLAARLTSLVAPKTQRLAGDAADEPVRTNSALASDDNSIGSDAAAEPYRRATTVPVLANYLPPSLLTTLPSPIDSIDPTPPGFKAEGIVGEIELMLLISSDGEVDDVLLMQSSLPTPFVDYAMAVFLNARFIPAMINTRAVRSRLRIVLAPGRGSAATDTGAIASMKSR